ncbi:hypothetical protein G5B37_14215 [Rasiella rasia]|uniref:Uncharacterized protein n=1 Tax=Rasiella rasia TaxID=2744027 RepID=A0A6G6GQG3_9FLAO|nr:hypothetical protein [Rasiella rasia]QIE60673.1 hypothetical protein G5B37_14215 [Rasiella rasia]
MRQITLSIITCFLIVSTNYAQTNIDEISSKITEVFEKTKAVKELATNKKTVLGQLEDFKNWQNQQLLDPSVSSNLEAAYSDYANAMNSIAEEMALDLKELSNYRDLKGARLDKFVQKFEHTYNDNIVEAYQIYNTGFLPHFEEAATKADSKVGIIGSIALILEFGDTIFGAIKSIFSKDGMSRKSKDALIELSIHLVSQKLAKQLSYPSWEELGMPSALPMETTIAFSRGMQQSSYTAPSIRTTNLESASPRRITQSPTYTAKKRNKETIQNTVSLNYYQSNAPIPLENVTKGIIASSVTSSVSDMALFTTSTPMQQGDKFWVTLEGNQHAQFYYFDEHLQSWQDPFGKGIIVGGANSNSSNLTTLPSKTSYFEITDDTAQEHFFMLISNQPISDIIKTGIIGSSVTSVSFLTALNIMIPLQYPNQAFTSEKLVLPAVSEGEAPTFYGVYVTIEKTNSQ